MHIIMKNDNGLAKGVKVGFSWTTLFFGFCPALFRGDLKWAVIMFLVSCVTFGISLLVFPFIYNKLYIKELIEKGYKPGDDHAKNILISKGILTTT